MEGQPWLKLGGKLVEAEVPGTTTEGDERWPQEARQRTSIGGHDLLSMASLYMYVCICTSELELRREAWESRCEQRPDRNVRAAALIRIALVPLDPLPNISVTALGQSVSF